MQWRPENWTAEEIAEGKRLKAEYKVREPYFMQNCSTCHR
jgi:hypothetical protein